jgi:Ssp1 endopeptidase immunity protein Rap1a
MMRPSYAALAAVLVGFSAVAAGEMNYDGYELARFAAVHERAMQGGGRAATADLTPIAYYQGFVNGVVLTTRNSGVFCPPISSTYGQLWATVAKFLRENPEQWNHDPAILVQAALAHAFPCPAGSKSR